MKEKKKVNSIQDVVDLASAFYGSAVLFAALDVNLFEQVEKGVLDTSARGMRLLADAAVALGLLEKKGEVYANSPAAKATLIPGAPADLTKAIRYNRDVYGAWGKLAEFARTGRPVEKPEIHLGEDPARTKAFAAAMFGRAMGIGRGVVPLLDLPRGEDARVLDLAGGPAAYAILMCERRPNLQVTTVDLPAISEEAKNYVAQAGLTDRISCRAGDYHTDSFGDGLYDAVTIFGALHQESPEQILRILKEAYRALKKNGQIFILDMMTDFSHTSPSFSALFAVNMALTTENGWVFSDAELKGWLKEAGFEPGPTVAVPPPMPHWLVIAEKSEK